MQPLLRLLLNNNDNQTTIDIVNIQDNNSTLENASTAVHKIQPGEVIILALLFSLWVVAVLSFLRKWASIRILQPVEPRYRHAPKNLDSVRVVQRPQDSVIYKNYSRKISVTMVAREKRRLQRMHTVPIMSALPSLPTIAMETESVSEA